MRIPSGTVDQVCYFIAVDATDLSTRETGLSSFTVYRARNGAAAAAMTTPTVTEVDATNMPGVYSLLLDEDMTIGSGNDSEEMVFHITHTGMAPVTRTIELYRPKITAGETLTVASGVASANATQISGDSTAADNLETMLDGTGGQTLTASITGNITGNLSGSVGSVTGNVGGNVTGSVGSLAAQAKADVNTEVVDALNTDTYAEASSGTPPATASIVTKLGYLYKAWRNKSEQTSALYTLYGDDGESAHHIADVSDDGTTFTRGEVGGAP